MPGNYPDLYQIVPFLIFLGLMPFIAIMVTSYIKLVVVLSLIRNALGVQQIPPNLVINGLAVILSVYIMAPVVQDLYDGLKNEDFSRKDMAFYTSVYEKVKKPLGDFLMKHSHDKERMFFVKSAKVLWPEDRAKNLKEDDLIVLIPSFTVSEITAAFQIGFLIYLPFVAIDLIVSNILLAMGMMMVSPMTISLPFKLLLFVLLNGWARLIHGLVLTYR
jgi:type III secretion protein R